MADSPAFPPSTSTYNKLQMSTASMNDWFSGDIAPFLNPEVIMDFQSITPIQEESAAVYYSTSSPEQTFSVSDAYSSSDSSETPGSSPFDPFSTDSIHSGIPSPADEALFEPFQLADPLIVPEIEKILAANPYQIDLAAPASPEIQEQTHSRKRQRENEPKAPVTLARDKLLTMTSKEIEDYVCDLKSKRTLTSAEEKELKKQRRLVKNREYASQSRSRKKNFVDDLEKQLEAARAETEEVKKQNKALLDENKLLKRQLGCIAETIKKSQLAAGKEPANGANLSSSSGSVATSMFDKFKIGAGRSSAAATKGVSACLLAIFFMVFTFAAFWDNDSNFKQPDRITFRQRDVLSFAEDAGVWEAATTLLRQSWESSAEYLPSWESAYSLFVSSYPVFFSPSSSSSSSSSSITPTPVTKAIEPVPCTEHSHPALPPTNNPNNETKRCTTRGSAS